MAIDFNSGPYFDDFDPTDNFYRVLFKPGYAVQARELNQLQSILQHQVSSVGKHLFKKNSMVIPGGIVLNTTADIISVTDIEDPSVLVGRTITNNPTFDASDYDPEDDSALAGYITAVVLAARAKTDTEPAALYVKYFKTGTNPGYSGKTFDVGQTIKTVGTTVTTFKIHPTIPASIGKVATLNAGTFFTKEVFVDVAAQSIIVETSNTTTTNCIIGLNITESIVTSDDDESLLDNANGTPNQYAPGADRYKIALTLERIDPTTAIDDEIFIKMMEVENNVIVYVNNKTEYAELMKTLARRTYDANGNFIVRGLETSITDAPGEDYIWANISRGKCYLGGYEYEQIAPVPIAIEKPRGTDFQQQMPEVVKYSTDMAFMYVAGGTHLTQIPNPDSLVQFTTTPPDGTDVVVGYGVFKDIQYAFGTVGTSDVYKMYFENISLNKGFSTSDIGGVRLPTASQGAAVLHEIRLYNIVGTFTAGNDIVSAAGGTETGLIYAVFNDFLYAIKDTTNAIPTGDVVKDATTSATATRRLTFVSNYDPAFIPMIEVDQNTFKTMYTDQGVLGQINTTSYSVITSHTFDVTEAGTYTPSTALSGGDLYEDFSTSDYFAYIVEDEKFTPLSSLIIVPSGTNYNLVVGEGSEMIGNTVIVYSTVIKSNVSEADKTLTTVANLAIPTPSNSFMALGHQDVQTLDKVVEGRTITITNAAWAANVATLTATYTIAEGGTLYQHAIGDTIVVRNIMSANNTGGTMNSGFNGIKVITDVSTAQATTSGITTVTATIKYALSADPGAFDTETPDATIALAPNINTDVDITSRYTIESGNTAYETGVGLLKKKSKTTSPAGQIGVKYKYYAVGVGGYTSVDSYGLYSGDLGYIGEISNVKDAFGNDVEVRRYIDFRIRPSNYFFKNIGTIANGSNILKLRDLNLSSRGTTLVGKYVVGPSHLGGSIITAVNFNAATGNTELTITGNAAADFNGTYYIGLNGSGLSLVDTGAGAKSFQFPKDGARFTYQYVKFNPRQVLVYVDRQEDVLSIKYDDVASLAEAAQFRRSEFKLPLVHIQMDPYTLDLTEVTPFKFENPVYQMLDIHNLKNKIERNEYYASLALNRDIEEEIRLAGQEGATTSAYGFWNEDFMDLSTQDFNSEDFACTVYDRSYAAPGVVTRTVGLALQTTGSTTWAQTGTALTLPYVETRAFGNDKASRFNNLNPYNMIQWTGKLVLNPSVDNWVDTTNVTNVTVNNTVNVTQPKPVVLPPVPVPTLPAPVLPAPPVEEIVVEITNLRTSWGPDSAGGKHGITFDWKTNLGRTGRVNTDKHLSKVVKDLGTSGYNGSYAQSLINKKYNDLGVKEYLNAGRHFDQKPPAKW